MASYTELNKRPAHDFLHPELFATDWDTPKLDAEQYEKGLEQGRKSRTVGVGVYGTWWANGKDGSVTTSYEGIGYHASTAALLRGFLDSGCKVVIIRWGDEGMVQTVIKGEGSQRELALA